MKQLTDNPKEMQKDIAKFYDMPPADAKNIDLNKMIIEKGGKEGAARPQTVNSDQGFNRNKRNFFGVTASEMGETQSEWKHNVKEFYAD